MQADFLTKKRRHTMLFFGMLLLLTVLFIIITEYDVAKGFTSIPAALYWALTNFYPNAKAMERLPNILEKLRETVLISIASTTVAALLAGVFAVLGSTTTRIHVVMAAVCRGIATVFRNIDVAAWAMILLFAFGQSALTGYFALFFVTFGALVRIFVETIDETSAESVEALRATGAGYLSVVFHSVIPSTLPMMISWVLYMVETNIRSATLVGILTGTGIGFAFDLYYKSLNYNAASLVVICIVATILFIEFISNYIRRVIL